MAIEQVRRPVCTVGHAYSLLSYGHGYFIVLPCLVIEIYYTIATTFVNFKQKYHDFCLIRVVSYAILLLSSCDVLHIGPQVGGSDLSKGGKTVNKKLSRSRIALIILAVVMNRVGVHALVLRSPLALSFLLAKPMNRTCLL